MPFLTIAGITVDVSVDDAVQLESVTVGDKRRMYDGTLRSTVRATKRAWRFTSPVLTQSQDATLRAACANLATVVLSGDIVSNASVNVKVTIGESRIVADGLSFVRATTITAEEV